MRFLDEISNNWPNDQMAKWSKCIQDSWILFIIVIDNITVY